MNQGSGPARGVRLCVDVGSVRVGLAASDPDAILAFPVETIARDQSAADLVGSSDLNRLAELVDSYQPVVVYVGLPVGLSGREGPAAQVARAYAQALAVRIAPISVRVVDERLTTVTAASQLRHAARRGKKQRQVIDQQAASVALQAALEVERHTGKWAGQAITDANLDQHSTN